MGGSVWRRKWPTGASLGAESNRHNAQLPPTLFRLPGFNAPPPSFSYSGPALGRPRVTNKIVLHLQLSDLRLQLFGGLRWGFRPMCAIAKNIWRAIQEQVLPRRDLVGVYFNLHDLLGYRQIAPTGCQGSFGIEFR